MASKNKYHKHNIIWMQFVVWQKFSNAGSVKYNWNMQI